MKRPECPNAANHTPDPEGYLQWHAWAARMARTHRQVQCADCGRLAIWIPKKKTLATLIPTPDREEDTA